MAGEHVALAKDGNLYGLRDMSSLIELLGDGFKQRLADAAGRALSDPFEVIPEGQAESRHRSRRRPRSETSWPSRNTSSTSSRALGHEANPVYYEIPVFYFTNPAAVRGPNDEIPMAPGTERFDYELEFAAVMGDACGDLDPATAEEHVAGYMVLCDWSARDIQAHELQGLLGPAKGKDTATSFSPYLVTPDELEPYRTGKNYALQMTAHVNGRLYSSGTSEAMYWSFGQLLAYASRGTTLKPGDIIGSGTVGTGCILELSRVHSEAEYPWLQPGDSVRLEVEHVGAVESKVVAGQTVVPL